MSRIDITSRDAERLARSFSDLIGTKGLQAIRRRAVNQVGAGLRKKTRLILPALIGTSTAALMIQGKAASPGSDNPAYRLRMASKVPVEKLKASRRKITRRRGRARLTLTLPNGDNIGFRSIARADGRIRLLKAGSLPERGLGGIFTNAARAFTSEGYDELRTLRRGAEKDLVEAVSTAIRNHLQKGRRR